MNPPEIFFDPQTGLLRSGWRVLVFVFVLLMPYKLLGWFVGAGRQAAEAAKTEAQFDLSLETMTVYVFLVIWVMFISWLCLRLLEQLDLGALGLAFYRGWWRDVLLGCLVSAVMMIAVVVIQMLSGGTRLLLNPLFWKTVDGARMIDWGGIFLLGGHLGQLLLLFIFAGAFEELLCRGYAFQTLLRGAPAIVPMLLLSLIFGLLHLENPNVTFFSIANTVLAGVWLSVAYLKTRGLWFPTALHFTWNWMMGAFFGLPVSGIKNAASSSVFLASNDAPLWLTGGSYGCEGGAAATMILLAATVVIWNARWLKEAESEGQVPELTNLKLEIPDKPGL